MKQQLVLDLRPIEIGGFALRARSASPINEKVVPTSDGWVVAMEFATAAEQASPYWIGDLLNYAEGRKDWAEKLDQMQSRTGLQRHTLINKAYVSRHVTAKARAVAPSYSHARAVAALEPAEQVQVLKEAVEKELTPSQTQKVAQRITRPKIIAGQAELRGKFRVIYADCPWEYNNDGAMPDGSLTPAASSYVPDHMSIEQLCALPVAAHTLPNAVLFQWATNAHLLEAITVGQAWGFEYKTNVVWNKVYGRPGPYGYMHHELLLIFTRGACTPDVPIQQHDHASIITERRSGRHSEKPESVRKQIMSLYPDGPYLELFGRKQVKGWTVYGNDAALWNTKERRHG